MTTPNLRSVVELVKEHQMLKLSPYVFSAGGPRHDVLKAGAYKVEGLPGVEANIVRVSGG